MQVRRGGGVSSYAGGAARLWVRRGVGRRAVWRSGAHPTQRLSRARWTRASARSIWHPQGPRGATSHRCSSRAEAERALLAVVREAYVAGVSTRRSRISWQLWAWRLSKSEVSPLCADIDAGRDLSRDRSPASTLSLARRHLCQSSRDGRIVSLRDSPCRSRPESARFSVWSIGASDRAVLGAVHLPPCRARPQRRQARHQRRARSVVRAITRLFGAAWQRCRVHFSATSRLTCPDLPRWLPPSSARSSSSQRACRLQSCVTSAIRSGRASPSRRVDRRRNRDLIALFDFPTSHRARFAPPIRSSVSTRRSSAAPPSSASFPTSLSHPPRRNDPARAER